MFSDWLRWPWGCCRKCEERLTGGDGDAEWKEAELLKEPGMFTGAELCSKLPPAREAQEAQERGRVRGVARLPTPGPGWTPGALPSHPAHPCPVPIVMLPGWGTVLLSKVFSRAATPNSFRSRSSRADSRDRVTGV